MTKKNPENHSRYSHGMSRTRPYRLWGSMKTRCLNPNEEAYKKYYGSKGITVCDRWMKFENFWEDMQDSYFEGASLDRIDNSKGYSPENCKWSTAEEQSNNRSYVTLYEFKGKMMGLAQIAREIGIRPATLQWRIRHGWDFKKATTTKVCHSNKKLNYKH